CEAVQEGRLSPGARLILSVVGAGLTWAAGVVLWTGAPQAPTEELVGALKGDA
ncbi:MAG: 3-oxoacyl-[acyl-carrier-protein] synthase III C-terminal domain-containing protein, partial [Actinomycetota bacterium]